ncbi:hypothetical protein [Hymenobacter chitinivorans]|uniref:SdpC family antimicrobial peptide n=1 Tax=Hymenobacter chitinivorans DSM 11115 TaxID=1121954 RepID=A0A2M9BMN2_9BACT|nr:hypothetical protein [Hymenobacter chitinivorans]PJJ59217.1 SdpC family antimicrobial peptide [Hymenobacter chitinivorans DSM 11115]
MLATFRKSTSLKALSLLAVGTSLMMSCSKEQVRPASAPTATSQVASASYSGEELFQGIFLMQGRVAAQIPSFEATRKALGSRKQHPEQQLKRQVIAARLVAAVRTLDPGYFAELRQAIASQNFNQIEQALRKGAALHHTALQQVVSATQLSKHQQQRNDALKQIDFAKYDFTKQADFERFLQESQAVAGTGTESGVAAQDELLIIDDGLAIVYVLLWYCDTYPGIVLGNEQEGINAQISEVVRKRADLEKEKLVRDLAFLSGSLR